MAIDIMGYCGILLVEEKRMRETMSKQTTHETTFLKRELDGSIAIRSGLILSIKILVAEIKRRETLEKELCRLIAGNEKCNE